MLIFIVRFCQKDVNSRSNGKMYRILVGILCGMCFQKTDWIGNPADKFFAGFQIRLKIHAVYRVVSAWQQPIRLFLQIRVRCVPGAALTIQVIFFSLGLARSLLMPPMETLTEETAE